MRSILIILLVTRLGCRPILRGRHREYGCLGIVNDFEIYSGDRWIPIYRHVGDPTPIHWSAEVIGVDAVPDPVLQLQIGVYIDA